MRRIEFIAPVESMRGNLGTRQNLVYAPNNNRAFDSIEGQVNPALNYESRLIGAKGKRNYFCVKTKSSVHLTQNSKAAMADFGGVGAVYAAIVRDKTSLTYIKIYGIYQKGVDEGHIHMSFRKYLSRYIGYMLKNKLDHYTFTDGIISAVINNPWINNEVVETYSQEILNKFWTELCSNGVYFYVNGQRQVGRLYMDIEELQSSLFERANTYIFTSDDNDYCLANDQYLLLNGEYVGWSNSLVPNGQYTTTNVAPE